MSTREGTVERLTVDGARDQFRAWVFEQTFRVKPAPPFGIGTIPDRRWNELEWEARIAAFETAILDEQREAYAEVMKWATALEESCRWYGSEEDGSPMFSLTAKTELQLALEAVRATRESS